jgi:hypothetical protein
MVPAQRRFKASELVQKKTKETGTRKLKPEVKRSLGRSRRKRMDNIKMDLR